MQYYDINLIFIKLKRIELGYSQKEVAKLFGFKNASSYYKLESGSTFFKAEQLPLLTQLLNCKFEDLFVKSKKNA